MKYRILISHTHQPRLISFVIVLQVHIITYIWNLLLIEKLQLHTSKEPQINKKNYVYYKALVDRKLSL